MRNIVLSTGNDLRTMIIVGECESIIKPSVGDSISSGRDRHAEVQLLINSVWSQLEGVPFLRP